MLRLIATAHAINGLGNGRTQRSRQLPFRAAVIPLSRRPRCTDHPPNPGIRVMVVSCSVSRIRGSSQLVQ